MHLGSLCMQLRAPIGFFLLLGANSILTKVQHSLVSPHSIKIVPNGMFFWCHNGIWGAFVLGPLHQNQHFFEGPTPPLSKRFFHLIDKIADFLHNKPCFLIAPSDLRYYWASAQPWAALRSLAQLTTPFLASGKAKNGVFSLRIAHIALFYTINFFF